ncbi:hypothetical protein [Streptomyces xinghaiensis]|uniref:hypothetical protein n=1 Tax=Streptomyces xinghaiensis TaxID=1038928 RepID=UPI002E16674A|nr:hypothetical protein OG463_11780 [Streptomyces xinghaiensis]
MKKDSMTTGLPLVIGTVIAAGVLVQDNYGGAVFAVVAGGVASLVLRFRSSRNQGRPNGAGSPMP